MQRLWKQKDADIFYLIEASAELPEGGLVLVDLRKQERRVDPAAVVSLRVPDDVARKAAVAEMTAIRASVGKGLADLAGAAKEIRRRTWAMQDATRPAVLAAKHKAKPPSTKDLQKALQPQLDAIANRLKLLLDEDGADADSTARLRRIAEVVRDNGGPDWTDDPAAIPDRLRAAGRDPAMGARLLGLWQDVRDGTVRDD